MINNELPQPLGRLTVHHTPSLTQHLGRGHVGIVASTRLDSNIPDVVI